MTKTKCPYCKTSYRRTNMAQKCKKTPLCRHHVSGFQVRRRWEVQAGTIAIANFVIQPMLDQFQDGNVVVAVHRVEHQLEKILNMLQVSYPVSSQIAGQYSMKVLDAAQRAWGVEKNVKIVHLLEAICNLISDILEFVREKSTESCSSVEEYLWGDLEKSCAALYNTINLNSVEYNDSVRTSEVYTLLYQAVWGSEASPPEPSPSLYLVNDTFWVVACGRAQVRRCIDEQFGLKTLNIQGVNLGTTLPGGLKASDLIAKANSIPQIVARITIS